MWRTATAKKAQRQRAAHLSVIAVQEGFQSRRFPQELSAVPAIVASVDVPEYGWQPSLTGLLAAIDSRLQSCTIDRPERNQMEVPMAIQAHLAELERKHEALENQLHDALNHPSTDDITIIEIKRRKLQVKDEIERLRSSATVH
jgi:hypothetical protein